MTTVTKATTYTVSLTQEQADILANILISTVQWDDGKTGLVANDLHGSLIDAGADGDNAPQLVQTESGYFKEVE